MKEKNNNTSWGKVAKWYDELIEDTENYQKDVILPNLIRLMSINKGDNILDVACGQGFFVREFSKLSLSVTGVDISKELIEIANEHNVGGEKYFVSTSHNLYFLKDKTIDKISTVLAIQNIEKVKDTLKEFNRVLKDGSKVYLVLNHPAFRIPKKSDWGFDEKTKTQYRKISHYMSEQMIKIDMNPGEKNIKKKEYTFSFHRPLQYYFKIFNDHGFKVIRLEEWCSNKTSQKGPRKISEDKARREIPMFMFIELLK
jgi:ubiquinone/menaquinone biosynthesis C-methylase UbiE